MCHVALMISKYYKEKKQLRSGWSHMVLLSCHPINFLRTRGVRVPKEVKKKNFCSHFLEEASVGVRRCL